MSAHAASLHATCLVLGEAGVLIVGGSGTGKTSLATALIDDAQRRGAFARLVADDRVRLTASGGRLLARPHPAIAGQVERRFGGIADTVHEPAVTLRLVLDLSGTGAQRLPDAPASRADYCGISLPCLRLPAVAPGEIPVSNLRAAMDLVRTCSNAWVITPNSP